ncbi:hypothetical protein BY996DRAFT_6409980 [Phakopsora pachyrhizi]|uniref:Expressed protein n=1 Tax=Phakopsora pachyrhizi TaxID=170000 RepID=A0AAV0BKF5_PHAPC|nr:hypothetical protein BY996DRAFT_6409980 [Phakopsora pachyrhizi]CAH7686588.1 expressed protein [Phakopsora pachyrhizi]
MIKHCAFILMGLMAFVSLSFAQLLPSAYSCSRVDLYKPPLRREDCRDSLNLFPVPNGDNVIYLGSGNWRGCGSCKVTIYNRGSRESRVTAPKGWAATAVHQAFDHCEGKPGSATIGDDGKIIAKIDYGNSGQGDCPP